MTTFFNRLMLVMFVLAAFLSCSKLSQINLQSAPEIPSDPVPADGAVLDSLDIEFMWTCSDLDGDPLTYDIYIDTVATPAIYDSLIDTTVYASARLYYNRTYYWQIVAKDSTGQETAGPVWSFVLGDDETLPIVTVTSPNGGELFYIGSMQNITWEASDDDSIASYRIEFSPNNGDTWLEIEDTTGNPLSYYIEIPDTAEAPASTRYLVRVSCRDAAGNIASDVSDEMFTIWPEGGMIAFVSDRDGDYDIFTMWADGSHQQNISNSSSFDYIPSWSPDCSKIAFYSNRSGVNQIYVMNSDGTDTVNISDNEYNDSYPAWSPNGDKIAFSTTRTGNYEVYIMNTDGSEQYNLTNNIASDWSCAWSPDALALTFHSYRDGNYEIYAMDNTGGSQTRLTSQALDDAYPSWSPSGLLITFSSWRNGNAEIYLMNFDGSNQHNISNHSSQDLLSQWSPDGNRIVFTSDRDAGNYDIYVMGTDGTNLVRLTSDTGYDGYPSWSPVD